jgi:ABC-type nitrate/sulfonate/bicarbonate transport system substrate-binding protein
MRLKMRGSLKVIPLIVMGIVIASCSSGPSATGTTTTSGPAPTGPLQTVNVAVPGFNYTQDAFYVADANGYFAAQGIKLHIDAVGSNLVTAIESGQDDLAYIGTGLALSIVHNGKPVSIIYNALGGGAGAVLAAHPGITSVSQCKSFATLAPGSAAYGWAVEYAKSVGQQTPNIIPVSTQASIVAAVVGGEADCGLNDYSSWAPALSQKQVVILSNTTIVKDRPKFIPPTFPEAAIFGLKTYLTSHTALTVKFLTAYQKAITNVVQKGNATQIAGLLQTSQAAQGSYSTMPLATVATQVKNALSWYSPNNGFIPKADWPQALTVFQAQGLTFVTGPTYSYGSVVDMSYYDKATGHA